MLNYPERRLEPPEDPGLESWVEDHLDDEELQEEYVTGESKESFEDFLVRRYYSISESWEGSHGE